jgi:beta-phosphoglucomutase-like phosphatase (HAD superfamily)
MLVIDLGRFGAFIFDLDGVITRTASVHARAWKRLFDEFLARQAAQTGTPFVPFNLETDYQRYVDGKPRVAGVLSFLAARDINLPMGDFGESAEQETVWKPSAASVYFQRRSQFLRDATSGVQAARAGGFGLVVGVGQAGHAADLLKSGADYVVADPSDVRLERRITSA